jgi:hypothetical protein
MAVEHQDWVTLEDAARRTAVPMTTIRDWYRAGTIDATTTPAGLRLVRVSQVREQATGIQREAGKVPSPRLGPPALRADAEAVAAINQTVQELQDLARERLEPQATR